LDSRIVLHRVSRVEGSPPDRKVFLRGDSHAGEHGPHREEDLIGKLAGVRRKGKWLGRLRWAIGDGAARAVGLVRRLRQSARVHAASRSGDVR
ncbi:MAG: hypothetical protein N3A38_07520, partial [Planctomycetota bacterium]|nr:hypothetical protein [Planctomycetota bacterium]